MYIVTGGAGFIGSAMVWQLNQLGITDILVVDHLASSEKWKNLVPLKYRDYIDRDEFASKIRNRSIGHIDAIIHLGACSATTERDADYLMDNNAKWTVELATWAVERESRFIYASSAATYGDGAQGFDDTADPYSLRPLNMYGYSKHLSDVRLHEAGHLDDLRLLVQGRYRVVKQEGNDHPGQGHDGADEDVDAQRLGGSPPGLRQEAARLGRLLVLRPAQVGPGACTRARDRWCWPTTSPTRPACARRCNAYAVAPA